MSNVIREDIVQISFQVEENPFRELLAQIKELKVALNGIDNIEELKKMADSARQAANGMEDLTQAARQANHTDTNELNNSVQETNRETKKAAMSFSQLVKEAAKLAKIKIKNAFKSLKTLPRTVFNKITGGINKMKNGFIKLKSMSFQELLAKLKQIASNGLNAGANAAKKLWDSLKKIGATSLKTLANQVVTLTTQMKKLAAVSAKALGKGLKNGILAVGKGSASLAKGIGKTIKGVSTGIVTAGVAAVKTGIDFDASMSQVAATMGYNVTDLHDTTTQAYKDFQMLNNVAREQGKNTKFSAAEAGEALNYLALAGYDARKAAGALPTVLTLASAGGMELAETSDMITDSMSALGIAATQKNLTDFGDKMAKASQKSNTSVKQLGSAILTVGGTAKNLTGGTTELNTALGILADSGIKGSEGGTKLRNIIQSLTPSTKPAVEAFKELGISAYDAKGEMRPLNDTFRDITDAMSAMTTEERTQTLKAMFGKTDLKAVSAMMGATATTTEQMATAFSAAEIPIDKLGISLDDMVKNFNKDQTQKAFVKNAMKEFGVDAEQAGVMYTTLSSMVGKTGNRWSELGGLIADSDGAMKDMADTMNDNLKGRITELGSATAETGLAINDYLKEPLKSTVEDITAWMLDLGTKIKEGGLEVIPKEVGSAFALAAVQIAEKAPIIINAATQTIDSFITSLTNNQDKTAQAGVEIVTAFISGIFTLFPKVVTGGAQLLAKFLEGMVQKLPSLNVSFQNGISSIVSGLKTSTPQIISAGMQLIMGLLQGFTQALPTLVNVAVVIINSLVASFQSNLPTIVSCAVTIIGQLISGLLQVLPNILIVGVQAIMILVQGLTQMLPSLLPVAMQAIMVLVQGLISMLPNIIMVGAQFIAVLAQGIGQMLPTLISIAIQLVGVFLQGALSALPMLIQAGMQVIICLVQGIFQAIPTLIQTAIQLIPTLVQAFISVLPILIQAGIELIVTLAGGLIQGIPKLIAAVPEIIGALIEAIMSTDWIEVGKKILSGIKDGITSGIKNIFGEKDAEIEPPKIAAPEMPEMPNMSDFKMPEIDTSTLTSNFSTIQTAGTDMSTSIVSSMGTTTESVSSASEALSNFAANATTGLETVSDMGSVGQEMGSSIADGINNSSNLATEAITNLTNQVKTTVDKPEIFDPIIQNATTSFQQLNTATTTEMQSFTTIIQTAMTQVITVIQEGINTIKNEFNNLNLYESGKNIMNGLLNGINSKKEELINTAKSIASSISNTINKELDIHSPSRVTFETGKFVALGAAEGMKANKEKVGQVGQDLGKEMAFRVRSGVAEYKPESNNTFNKVNSSSTTNHHYNANFNLTINGNTKDKATERTVKKWIKEGIDEYFKSIGRTSPSMQEV